MGKLRKVNDSFYSRNEKTGLLELIDCLTGEVLAVEKAPGQDMVEASSTPSKYLYNNATADLICNEVAKGKSLTKICKEDWAPSYEVVRQWRARRPEFAEMLIQAKRDRAEHSRDKMVEVAEEVFSKDEAPRRKLLTDVYKYLAQVDDSKTYQPKTQVEANVTATQIVIETGVRLPGDPGFYKDEAKRVEDEGMKSHGALLEPEYETSDDRSED